uniref:Uncharacterized protein n=1 Tax=uncultured bacterium 5G4 TaxID=1701326 RepID=A0A166H301_9BACT|nr:hypothetical protein 5G4_016 [uncultured bacterium 5G4]
MQFPLEMTRGPSFEGPLDSVVGGGRGIRTPDLRVMSPTSYRCSIPRRMCEPAARMPLATEQV